MEKNVAESSKKGKKRARRDREAILAAMQDDDPSRRSGSIRIGPPVGENEPVATSNSSEPQDKGKGIDTGTRKPKKGRGRALPSKPKTVEKIEFDEYGIAVGTDANKLISDLGLWVRAHIPITYDNWHYVPADLKDRVFHLMTQKYADENLDAVELKKKMGKMLRDARTEATKRIRQAEKEWELASHQEEFDAMHTRIQGLRPPYCSQETWDEFVASRQSDAWKANSTKYSGYRASQKLMHRTSRMGFRRLTYKLKKEAADPSTVTRSVVWTKGYLGKQTVENADPKLRQTIDEIKKYDTSELGQKSSSWRDDGVSHVFGAERHGRVRGMGFGVTPSKVSAVCGIPRVPEEKNDQRVDELLSEIDVVRTALAEQGINYDELINRSVSRPKVPDAGSRAHGIIDVGIGASHPVPIVHSGSMAGSVSHPVPIIHSGSMAGSVSHSVPALVSQSVPDESNNSQLQAPIWKKVRLMHLDMPDITVAVGEVMSTNPDDTVHTV